jgi:hypothetical protein
MDWRPGMILCALGGNVWGTTPSDNFLEMDEEIDSSDNDDDGNDSSEEDDMDDSREEDSDEEETSDEEEEEVHDEIVHNFGHNFHKGDYDVEFDEALNLDRAVTLPARSTQASYMKPDNWVERNRIGLEKVKEQLQGLSNKVSQDNRCWIYLIHNGYGDDEEPIVWHESILDEYWDQLEATIDRMRQLDRVADISRIHIMNVEMKKERLATLVAIFRSGRATNSSTCLDFNNANLCEEGIVSLSKLVDVSSELQYFYLSHNRIDNMDSARCLSRSIKSHACINQLYLCHCDLVSSPEILLTILQSDVKCIYLDNNNIDSLGAATIAEYLESDPPIKELCLDYNRLNDDDVILISQSLKRNTNLKTLHIHTNNFTSIGVKALLNCVFDGSSLNAISESNHKLEKMDIFLSQETTIYSSPSLEDCIDKLLNLNRTQKIFLALQDKDSLLQYLANVPVELIPEVLEFTRWVDDQPLNKHLNIFYSIMRWWNMPVLYSHY